GDWGLGIGDWGLDDWGLGVGWVGQVDGGRWSVGRLGGWAEYALIFPSYYNAINSQYAVFTKPIRAQYHST
ncbi:MAG: hypothetical protein KKD28_14620, partial [Chloroflexi bacterium]|nr:hypothetical protein [Chloroflexota bacterium]